MRSEDGVRAIRSTGDGIGKAIRTMFAETGSFKSNGTFAAAR
jgi:hypothetical protein